MFRKRAERLKREREAYERAGSRKRTPERQVSDSDFFRMCANPLSMVPPR